MFVGWSSSSAWQWPSLARKNRPVQGVTHSRILHGVIFITFTKHSKGCFSQLLTQVWVIFVSKTGQEPQKAEKKGEMLHLVFLSGARLYSLFWEGNPFDILVIMKVRHSFSLDDPWTSTTIPFPLELHIFHQQLHTSWLLENSLKCKTVTTFQKSHHQCGSGRGAQQMMAGKSSGVCSTQLNEKA